jgi:hypothetical protein
MTISSDELQGRNGANAMCRRSRNDHLWHRPKLSWLYPERPEISETLIEMNLQRLVRLFFTRPMPVFCGAFEGQRKTYCAFPRI